MLHYMKILLVEDEEKLAQALKRGLELDGYTQATVRFDPSKPSMIPRRFNETRLAREALGFQPRVTLREGLSATLRWYHDRTTPPIH